MMGVLTRQYQCNFGFYCEADPQQLAAELWPREVGALP